MDFRKAALLLFWLATVACFFAHEATLLITCGKVLFIGLAVIHFLEWIAFRDLLKGSRNGALGNFSGTMLFGILHIQEVRAEVEGHVQES